MAFQGKDYTFNAYAAGNKVYNGFRSSPHFGGGLDRMGYKERDRATKAKRNALLRRMKKNNAGKFMSSDWLGGSR